MAGEGKSFFSCSTRLRIKEGSCTLNIDGGTRPCTFSMTNPIVVIQLP